MRYVILAGALFTALLVVPASAQRDSQEQDNTSQNQNSYCGRGGEGSMSCNYSSMEQCQSSFRAGQCLENPRSGGQ